MSSQSNTSVHWTTMFRKKNLCVGSVVTLFLLRLVVVLLEFFFPEKNIINLSLFLLLSKQNRFSIKEIIFFISVIGYDYPNFLEHTMLDTKVTLRLSIYCNFCWFFTDKVNFFSFSSYLHRHNVLYRIDFE